LLRKQRKTLGVHFFLPHPVHVFLTHDAADCINIRDVLCIVVGSEISVGIFGKITIAHRLLTEMKW